MFLGMQVSGIDVPKPCYEFGQFGFDSALMKSIEKQAFTEPTPIQKQVRLEMGRTQSIRPNFKIRHPTTIMMVFHFPYAFLTPLMFYRRFLLPYRVGT
jgi:hypothetical protein